MMERAARDATILLGGTASTYFGLCSASFLAALLSDLVHRTHTHAQALASEERDRQGPRTQSQARKEKPGHVKEDASSRTDPTHARPTPPPQRTATVLVYLKQALNRKGQEEWLLPAQVLTRDSFYDMGDDVIPRQKI